MEKNEKETSNNFLLDDKEETIAAMKAILNMDMFETVSILNKQDKVLDFVRVPGGYSLMIDKSITFIPSFFANDMEDLLK